MAISRVIQSRSARGALWAVAAFAILLWTGHGSLYTQNIVELCAVYATLALSLNLAAGLMGQFSLGHAGLFAIGAYGAAVSLDTWHTSTGVALLVAVGLTAAAGLVVGAVSLRLGGLYFALVTLAFAVVVDVVAQDWTSVTGGYQGLVGPLFPAMPSWLTWAGDPLVWCGGLVVLVAAFFTASLKRSPLYATLSAIRSAEPMAVAAGIRVSGLKIGIFALSAGIAGAAGWLFVFLGFVSPDSFQWTVSVQLLVMVLLGGINTVLGPILGAVAVTLFPEYVPISPEWVSWTYGVVLILVVVLVPEGVVGAVRRTTRRAARDRLNALIATDSTTSAAAPEWRGRTSPEPAVVRSRDQQARGTSPEPAIAVEEDQAIVCTDVTFRYGRGVYALEAVGLRIRRGTIHAIIGPNGSGKTTLISVISGFLRPERGSIVISGRDVTRSSPAAHVKRGLVRTFQVAAVVGELSCIENCNVGRFRSLRALPLRAPLWLAIPSSRRAERELRARNLELLRWLGLEQWADVAADEVPQAVQRGLQLAVASVGQPGVVMLDEPMAGLTPPEIEELMRRLLTLRDSGVTVVLIEHHVRAVFAVADEVTVLNAGRVIATGAPAEVRADKLVQSAYLGTALVG